MNQTVNLIKTDSQKKLKKKASGIMKNTGYGAFAYVSDPSQLTALTKNRPTATNFLPAASLRERDTNTLYGNFKTKDHLPNESLLSRDSSLSKLDRPTGNLPDAVSPRIPSRKLQKSIQERYVSAR